MCWFGSDESETTTSTSSVSCSPRWIRSNKTAAGGSSLYKRVSTLQECLDACVTNLLTPAVLLLIGLMAVNAGCKRSMEHITHILESHTLTSSDDVIQNQVRDIIICIFYRISSFEQLLHIFVTNGIFYCKSAFRLFVFFTQRTTWNITITCHIKIFLLIIIIIIISLSSIKGLFN